MKNRLARIPGVYWLAFVLAIVLAGIVLWTRGQRSEIVYREVKVARGDMEQTILSTGVVQPSNRLDIKAPIDGRAEQVLVQEGQEVKKNQILAWISSSERASLLDAARARGPEEVAKWEDFYKASPIISPIDGTIIQRNVQPGQIFTKSDAVLVMSDRLNVEAQVDETDIAQVHPKQQATIVLDAYPRDKVASFVERVAYDAKTVNNVTTYTVHVVPLKTPTFMRSGMTANVSFDIGAKRGILVLPSEAIKRRHDGASYVLVPAPESGKPPIEHSVQTGATDGKRIEIVAGLQENDSVLLPQLKAGAKPAGANPFGPPGPPKRSTAPAGGGH